MSGVSDYSVANTPEMTAQIWIRTQKFLKRTASYNPSTIVTVNLSKCNIIYCYGIVFCAFTGYDLELQSGFSVYCFIIHVSLSFTAAKAIHDGKLKESFVRDMVKPLFYTRMRLGEFDPPQMSPYSTLDIHRDVLTHDHFQLAVEVTSKTFVLLKNDGVLPIKHKYGTIGVRPTNHFFL